MQFISAPVSIITHCFSRKCWVDTITWIYTCKAISHIGTICKVLGVLCVWAGFWLIHVFAQPITTQPFNQLNARPHKITLVQFSLSPSNARKFGTDVNPNQIRRNFRSESSPFSPSFSHLIFTNIFFLMFKITHTNVQRGKMKECGCINPIPQN